MSDISVTTLQEQPTLGARATCSFDQLGDTIGRTLNAAFDAAQAAGAIAGPPYVRYFTFSQERIELESGFPVAAGTEGAGEVVPSSLPGGRAAVLRHVGHYDALPQAHEEMHRYLAEQSLSPTEAAWEVYLNDPRDTALEELQTDVVYPIA